MTPDAYAEQHFCRHSEAIQTRENKGSAAEKNMEAQALKEKTNVSQCFETDGSMALEHLWQNQLTILNIGARPAPKGRNTVFVSFGGSR